VGATLRGGGVLVSGALVGVLAIGAALRTLRSERDRALVLSASMLLARVHPSRQYLLIDPGIG
jgi:hypothetical protein